jgi:predicted metal-dependent hydrolase
LDLRLKSVKTCEVLAVGEVLVPLTIYIENRLASRVSLGQTVVIRLPRLMPSRIRNRQLAELKTWAVSRLEALPHLAMKMIGNTYSEGSIVRLLGDDYRLNLVFAVKASRSYIDEHSREVRLILSKCYEQDQGYIKQRLERTVQEHFLPWIESKVDELNDHYFAYSINQIRLKNTRSSWGSCTLSRKLTFSLRLLQAPEFVINYVCVHELAHLKEMNHSAKFWTLVGDAIPDYKLAISWLKENGTSLYF